MNNFLLAIAGIICAILVAIIFAPFFIDWNSYKSEIEAAGRRVTGQNVQIIGDVEMRFLPQPVFHTGGLIITNAEDKKLLETNDFSLELDFPSLLRGKIEVTIMNLNDGKIFVSKAAGSSLDLFNFGGAIGKPIGLEDISINKLVLNNMDVEFSNAELSSQKTLSFAQAEVTARSLKGPFKIKGLMNVNANDTTYQRQFSAAIGKYIAEKPLTVKAQVNGEQKGSRLGFLGNLVGLETQPLLVGQLSVKGKKGENLIGYGQSFSSLLSDDLEITSDISLNYSALEVENLKIAIGSAENNDLSQSLKVNGNMNYAWARNPSLTGALNIGLADFNYVKKLFLAQNDTEDEQAVYQSLQELSDMAKSWISNHVIIGADDGDAQDFEGNLSLNIEQVSFLQNNIIDRVRLITSLVNIDDGQVTMPQFSAHFPGNGRLIFAMSKQAVGQSEDRLMTGQYEFNALHMRKFTNWLLFKNEKLNNIAEFWGLNDQVSSKGNIDLLLDGLRIGSPLVKTRKYQFALDYSLANRVHDVDISFEKIDFDNQDLLGFKSYIAPYVKAGFVASDEAKPTSLYHLLPKNIITDIGDLNVNIHSDQSYYGIRDLGVFDAEILFNGTATELKKLTLVGDKIFITADAKMQNEYAEKNIIDAEKNEAIVNFSIIEADMNLTPQLTHDLLFEDNLFMNKIIPNKGALNVTGRLMSTSDEGGFYLEASGKIGTSDLDIGAEISLNNGKLVQKDLQYQLSNPNTVGLLAQFGLSDLLDEINPIAADEGEAVVRLIISQNPQNLKSQNVKFIALAGDQNIEFIAETTQSDRLHLIGDLRAHVNSLGFVAQQLGLFNGNFNQLNGLADFDAKIEIIDDLLHVTSQKIRILDSEFTKLNLDVSASDKISFNANADKFHITNLIKFFAGEHKAGGQADLKILDSESQETISTALDIFNGDDGQPLEGFDVKMIKNVEFNGKVLVKKLYLSDSIILNNAEIIVRSGLGENAIFIDYKGGFLNTNLSGEFIMKPADNQLYMDINLRAFAVDVEQLTADLGFANQYIAGVVDVEVDLAGQAYSVDGLLANLKGLIDVDLTGLKTNHINSDYFNAEIENATDEATIDDIFINFIIRNAANDASSDIKISPEKLSLKFTNGLASIAQPITFQKANVKSQTGMLSGQLDLTSNTSQFVLQIPLSNDEKTPKLLLEWLSVDGTNTENINFEGLQEYYKVKLLEKNVQRLEDLQVEIKRKNDAEIERYQKEKFEAEAFKEEIKVRVEKAIDARKMREMVAKKPPIPTLMPFIFMQGSPLELIDGAVPNDADLNVTNSDLLPMNVGEYVVTEFAILRAKQEAAQQEADRLKAEAELKAQAAAQKLVDEAPDLELTLDSDDPIADFIDSSDLIDEDLINDGGGFDTGSLTSDDAAANVNDSGAANPKAVKISPLPKLFW